MVWRMNPIPVAVSRNSSIWNAKQHVQCGRHELADSMRDKQAAHLEAHATPDSCSILQLGEQGCFLERRSLAITSPMWSS